MAGCRLRATKSGVATGTALKTIVQLVAAANHAVLVKEISISFAGVSNTSTPILVQVSRQTTAGTMSSLTPVKDPDDWAETMQTTALHTATVEPTTTDVLIEEYVHPQTGWTELLPFGQDIKIGGGDRLGIRVTAGTDVSCAARFVAEE